jgi:rubredoxin
LYCLSFGLWHCIVCPLVYDIVLSVLWFMTSDYLFLLTIVLSVLWFMTLYCLSFGLWYCIVCPLVYDIWLPISFDHCIVCPLVYDMSELQISCVFAFFTLWKRVKTHVLSDQSVHITHTYCCVSKLSKFGAYLYSRVHNNTCQKWKSSKMKGILLSSPVSCWKFFKTFWERLLKLSYDIG